MKWTTLPLLWMALALTGCTGMRLVDSEVQTFSRLPALPATPTYSFERLPSQQAQDAQQTAVETQAQQALAKVGMRQASAAAVYRAQVDARTRQQAPYDPWWGWGGWGMGRGLHGSIAMRFPPPNLYHREVSLVLREAASGAVVYETRAVHEGVWHDDPAVFAAMFDAALNGFPAAPAGPRRVTMEIPR
jgi:hypothetical protein